MPGQAYLVVSNRDSRSLKEGRKFVCFVVILFLLLFCFLVWFGWHHSLMFVLMLAQEQQQHQDPEATGLPESEAQGLLSVQKNTSA